MRKSGLKPAAENATRKRTVRSRGADGAGSLSSSLLAAVDVLTVGTQALLRFSNSITAMRAPNRSRSANSAARSNTFCGRLKSATYCAPAVIEFGMPPSRGHR